MGKQNEKYTHRCKHKHFKLYNFEIVPSDSRLCYNFLLFNLEVYKDKKLLTEKKTRQILFFLKYQQKLA